jgi:hypothetical protein
VKYPIRNNYELPFVLVTNDHRLRAARQTSAGRMTRRLGGGDCFFPMHDDPAQTAN